MSDFFTQRTRLEQDASQLSPIEAVKRKTRAAREALQRLDAALTPALQTAIEQRSVLVARTERRRVFLSFATAATTSLFVLLPLIRGSLGIRSFLLLIPATCSILAILISPESASRFALLGSSAAAVLMGFRKLRRDQESAQIEWPDLKKLIVAFSVGFLPVALYVYVVGFMLGSWIDKKIDDAIDRTEQVTVGAVGGAGQAVQRQAENLKAAWYDPREIFVYQPLRSAVKGNAEPATAAATTSVRLFYSLLRSLLQGARLLSLIGILWAIVRFAVLVFVKAIVFAGGKVHFELSPR